jgi:NAD(P)-dependent dehydrogenase (short-subunit alcohol dehydrogenase family)
MNLQNKHILVTGASDGIGKETAIQAAKSGARLSLISRRNDELEKLVIELNKINNQKHAFYAFDLNHFDDYKSLVTNLDAVDGIVHSAGIVSPFPTKYIRKKHIDHVFHINTYAPIILNAELLTQNKINNNSSIVFISSISTQHPYIGGAVYVASKAAIESYSKNLALELSDKKIRSNVVSPALVKTNIFNQTVENYTEEQIKKYEKQYPFGFGESTDVAKSILFFLSEESKWITGQNLILDGGLLINTK